MGCSINKSNNWLKGIVRMMQEQILLGNSRECLFSVPILKQRRKLVRNVRLQRHILQIRPVYLQELHNVGEAERPWQFVNVIRVNEKV